MNKKNISPHVQIYKFPITALSSITTRLTGLYLSGVFIAYGVAKIQNHDALIWNTYDKSNYYLQTMFHYSLLFPTIYHTMGGVRHFVWDRFPSSLLTNTKVARSSYVLFAASSASTFLVETYMKKERK